MIIESDNYARWQCNVDQSTESTECDGVTLGYCNTS